MSFDKLNLEILAQIQAVLPAGSPAYLVGGAVRDLLLNRLTHDLDFVVPENAIAHSRNVANALSGGFHDERNCIEHNRARSINRSVGRGKGSTKQATTSLLAGQLPE
jgi:tRNA nucleotidyltransferase/poly(A) polymerase